MVDNQRNMLPPNPGPSPQRPFAPAQPQAGLTPKEIIAILRRHILLISVCTVVGLFLGVGGYFAMARLNPQYTATGLIHVDPPESSDPMSVVVGSSNKDVYYLFRQTKASLIKQQSMLQELLKQESIKETGWYQQFVNKQGVLNDAKAVRDLEKKLGAVAEREAEYIRVSMKCGSASDAARIVNQMVSLYLKQQHEQATKEYRDRLGPARNQQEKLWADLKSAQKSLAEIRQANPNIAEFSEAGEDSDVRHSIKVRRDTLEVRESDLEQQISQIEAQIATLAERASGSFDEVVREQVENDPIAIQARQTILVLRPELARKAAKLGENHREVRQLREQLRQSEQELSDRQNFIAELARQADLQNAEDAKTILLNQLETYKRQLQEAQVEQKQLDEIRSEYTAYTEMRDKKIEKLDQIEELITTLELKINQPAISKLSREGLAPKPLRMSSPRLILYGPGGFMLGIMAGLGLAFLIEMSNDTVRTPSEVMKTLRVPLLGMICHSDDDDDLEGIDHYQVIRQAPYSMTSECYRQLKTSIKLSSTGTHKTLAFTSGAPGEGKTTVAVNLASALVAEGRRILFIDANFRRPTSAKLFPAVSENGSAAEHSDYGLSNLLMGQCEADAVVRKCAVEGLEIVDSGPLPANPAELLASPAMRRFLDQVNQIYDYVILDSPPMIISDAKTIASVSDATIVVFNATTTKKGAAQRTLRELSQINAPVIGSVLVAVRSLKGGYFQEQISTYQNYQRTELARQGI